MEEALKAKARNTPQKLAISQALSGAQRPLTVPEVHTLAQGACAQLGVATVYRAVNRLVQEGWLTEVRLPDQPVRYELTSLEHHHHFHCERCQQVMDLTAPCQALTASLPEGFQVSRHEVTFYGVCPACA